MILQYDVTKWLTFDEIISDNKNFLISKVQYQYSYKWLNNALILISMNDWILMLLNKKVGICNYKRWSNALDRNHWMMEYWYNRALNEKCSFNCQCWMRKIVLWPFVTRRREQTCNLLDIGEKYSKTRWFVAWAGQYGARPLSLRQIFQILFFN